MTKDHLSITYRYPFYKTLIFKNVYGTPTIYNCLLMLIHITDTIYQLLLTKSSTPHISFLHQLWAFEKRPAMRLFFKMKSSTLSPLFWRVDIMMYQRFKDDIFFVNYIISVMSFYLIASVTYVTVNTVCWLYVKNGNLWLIKERIQNYFTYHLAYLIVSLKFTSATKIFFAIK